MGLIKVTINVYGAPEPGSTYPSFEMEKDIWLTEKKLKSRIAGLATLDPLKTVAPGCTACRASIQFHSPSVWASIDFDGESFLKCHVQMTESVESYSANIPLEVAQILFLVLEAGIDPCDFFKERHIDYYISEYDVYAPPRLVKNSD